MTVNELMERLSGMDPDTEVYFSYDYGDHSHTPAAIPVEDVEENVPLGKTAYSPSGECIERDDDEIDEETKRVMVLS